jgi:hypothetical protein
MPLLIYLRGKLLFFTDKDFMVQMVAKLTVDDYQKWKQVFSEGQHFRQQFGCQGVKVFTNPAVANEIIMLMDWDTPENAQKFAVSSELREKQQLAGVQGEVERFMLSDQFPA